MTKNILGGMFHQQEHWRCASDGSRINSIASFVVRSKIYVVESTDVDFSVFEIKIGDRRSARLLQKWPAKGIERLEIIRPNDMIMLIAAGTNINTQIYR